MNNYDHKKVIEATTRLDAVPANRKLFSEWIEAKAHIDFLRNKNR